MKYTRLRIDQEGNGWKVLFIPDSQDRVSRETKPNPIGFYHFPETKDRKEALNELIVCMAEAHIKKVERVQMSLNELLKLQGLQNEDQD